MAGHSKWANIKHRKAAQDAKRGKIFTKLIREITTSARLGDADPANNPRLRAAVAAVGRANPSPSSTAARSATASPSSSRRSSPWTPSA